MQLLSLTLLSCPPAVHLPYYKQSMAAELAGNCGILLDRARTSFDHRKFQIAYAQAPQLYVAQYLQPNLHMCLAHDSGLAS